MFVRKVISGVIQSFFSPGFSSRFTTDFLLGGGTSNSSVLLISDMGAMINSARCPR